MKVVLDTNVLVSGVLSSSGTCSQVLDLVIEGTLALCADDRILAEYEEVLHRPELKLDPSDTGAVLGVLRAEVELVAASPLAAVLPDASDLPFLEVAAAAGEILVTGNLRHFPAPTRGGVEVMRPAELLELLRHSG